MNLKNASIIVTFVVIGSGAVWGAAGYLQQYVEKPIFEAKCAEWSENFAGLKNEWLVQKYQTRMWQLEQWIRDLENAFGPNCQSCPNREKSMYWEMRKEHDWLKQQIRQITGYGG